MLIGAWRCIVSYFQAPSNSRGVSAQKLAGNCAGTADWMVADPIERPEFRARLARSASMGSVVLVDPEEEPAPSVPDGKPLSVHERDRSSGSLAESENGEVSAKVQAAETAAESSEPTMLMLSRLQACYHQLQSRYYYGYQRVHDMGWLVKCGKV